MLKKTSTTTDSGKSHYIDKYKTIMSTGDNYSTILPSSCEDEFNSPGITSSPSTGECRDNEEFETLATGLASFS